MICFSISIHFIFHAFISLQGCVFLIIASLLLASVLEIFVYQSIKDLLKEEPNHLLGGQPDNSKRGSYGLRTV